MISRTFSFALHILTLFYLVAQTEAIPAICQPSALKAAVNCGCFLYRPLYESDSIWGGLRDICLQELSGNISTGESSCESALFDVSSQDDDEPNISGVPTASLESAEEYFADVLDTCKDYAEVARRLEEAEERFEEEQGDEESNEIDDTDRRLALFQAQCNYGRSSSSSSKRSSTTLPTKTLTFTDRGSQFGRKFVCRQLAAKLGLNMLPTAHFERRDLHRSLGEFCVTCAQRMGRSPSDAVRTCCPQN